LDGHCVLYKKDIATKEVFDRVYAVAKGYTVPLLNKEFSKGITKCFQFHGPHYHNRVPRFPIANTPKCKDGYLACEPLGPDDPFDDMAYRCTGPETDIDEELRGQFKMVEVEVNQVPIYETPPPFFDFSQSTMTTMKEDV